jgi:hypothetical protein
MYLVHPEHAPFPPALHCARRNNASGWYIFRWPGPRRHGHTRRKNNPVPAQRADIARKVGQDGAMLSSGSRRKVQGSSHEIEFQCVRLVLRDDLANERHEVGANLGLAIVQGMHRGVRPLSRYGAERRRSRCARCRNRRERDRPATVCCACRSCESTPRRRFPSHDSAAALVQGSRSPGPPGASSGPSAHHPRSDRFRTAARPCWDN